MLATYMALSGVALVSVALYIMRIRRGGGGGTHTSRKIAGGSAIVAMLSVVSLVVLAYRDIQVQPWPREFIAGQQPGFSGVPGVSVEQERWANSMASSTAMSLKRWENYQQALDDGFVRFTTLDRPGYLHLINREYLNDTVNFDANRPESLVYAVVDGKPVIVAAMYYAAIGTELGDPELRLVGGNLVEWHTHGNLCTPKDPDLRDDTKLSFHICGQGNIEEIPVNFWRVASAPMVHVWVASNKCGVFAAIDDVILSGMIDEPKSKRVDMC